MLMVAKPVFSHLFLGFLENVQKYSHLPFPVSQGLIGFIFPGEFALLDAVDFKARPHRRRCPGFRVPPLRAVGSCQTPVRGSRGRELLWACSVAWQVWPPSDSRSARPEGRERGKWAGARALSLEWPAAAGCRLGASPRGPGRDEPWHRSRWP